MSTFGGSSADVIVDPDDHGPSTAQLAITTAYNGGENITDLTDMDGNPINIVTPNQAGLIAFKTVTDRDVVYGTDTAGNVYRYDSWESRDNSHAIIAQFPAVQQAAQDAADSAAAAQTAAQAAQAAAEAATAAAQQAQATAQQALDIAQNLQINPGGGTGTGDGGTGPAVAWAQLTAGMGITEGGWNDGYPWVLPSKAGMQSLIARGNKWLGFVLRPASDGSLWNYPFDDLATYTSASAPTLLNSVTGDAITALTLDPVKIMNGGSYPTTDTVLGVPDILALAAQVPVIVRIDADQASQQNLILTLASQVTAANLAGQLIVSLLPADVATLGPIAKSNGLSWQCQVDNSSSHDDTLIAACTPDAGCIAVTLPEDMASDDYLTNWVNTGVKIIGDVTGHRTAPSTSSVATDNWTEDYEGLGPINLWGSPLGVMAAGPVDDYNSPTPAVSDQTWADGLWAAAEVPDLGPRPKINATGGIVFDSPDANGVQALALSDMGYTPLPCTIDVVLSLDSGTVSGDPLAAGDSQDISAQQVFGILYSQSQDTAWGGPTTTSVGIALSSHGQLWIEHFPGNTETGVVDTTDLVPGDDIRLRIQVNGSSPLGGGYLNSTATVYRIDANGNQIGSPATVSGGPTQFFPHLYTRNGAGLVWTVREVTVTDRILAVAPPVSGGTTAPAPVVPTPTGLAASAITDTTATVAWTASTSDTAVTGYEVELNGTSLGTTANTTYNLTGLAASTQQTVRVRAQDTGGDWSDWGSLTFTTTATPVATPPAAPTGLGASAITDTTATISWTASTPGSAAVSGYEVEMNGTSLGVAAGTSRNLTGLVASTQQSVRVRAQDANGTYSDWTAAYTFSTTAAGVTPIAAYSFEETYSSILDHSGHGRNLNLGSSTMLSTATKKNGNKSALSYNSAYILYLAAQAGTNPASGAIAPDLTAYDTPARSWSAWIKFAAPDTRGDIDMIRYRDTAGNTLFGFLINQTRTTIKARWGTSAGLNEQQIPITADTNWHHYAQTYDQTTGTGAFYIDGVQVATVNVVGPLEALSSTLTFDKTGNGQSTGSWNYLDDLRFYNVAITAAQVVSDMNTPVS